MLGLSHLESANDAETRRRPATNPETRKLIRQNLSLSTLGLEMGASVLLGIFGGKKLDEWLGTEPVFFWIGMAAGLAAAGRALFLGLRKARKILEGKP